MQAKLREKKESSRQVCGVQQQYKRAVVVVAIFGDGGFASTRAGVTSGVDRFVGFKKPWPHRELNA